MARKLEHYRFRDGVTPLSETEFNRRFFDIDARIHALEETKISWEETLSTLNNLGLRRINEVLLPTLQQLEEKLDEIKEEWEETKENIQNEAEGLLDAIEDRLNEVENWFTQTKNAWEEFFASIDEDNDGIIDLANNADKVDGYDVGNNPGQVPVSNGTLCTSLNADKVDGLHFNIQSNVPQISADGTNWRPFRVIYVSTSAPGSSDGVDGDVWLQYS